MSTSLESLRYKGYNAIKRVKTMKNYMIATVAAIGICFSLASQADHRRSSYDDGYYGRGRHVEVHHQNFRQHRYDRRHHNHWRQRDRGYHHHLDRARYRRHGHDHGDAYKWIGGMYLLNEILHHDHHR